MYGIYQQLRLEALTDGYGNVFLVTAIALGALSGFWLRMPKTGHSAVPSERITAAPEAVQEDHKQLARMMH